MPHVEENTQLKQNKKKLLKFKFISKLQGKNFK